MKQDINHSPEAVWLSPACEPERTWAAPAPETACDHCGKPWVRYVREDLAQEPAADVSKRCADIADQVVPEYRHGKRTYGCGSHTAKRWGAAYDAVQLVLGAAEQGEKL